MENFTAIRICLHFKGFAKGKISKNIELKVIYLIYLGFGRRYYMSIVQARVLSIPKHATDVSHAIDLRTESGLTVEVPLDKLTIVLRYYLASAVDANATRSANIKMLSV